MHCRTQPAPSPPNLINHTAQITSNIPVQNGRQSIVAIQYLRAVAATMVLIFHYTELKGIPHFFALASGVDIFFVLSGFLMVYITPKDSSGLAFLTSRLRRIAPIYVTLTLIISIAILIKPSLTDRPVDIWVMLRSLVFLPSNLGPNTIQTTVIPVGWTLVYEMFFYVIFAIAISLKAPFYLKLLFLPTLTFAIHNLPNPPWWVELYGNPIIIEFAIGMLVARAPKIQSQKIAGTLFFAGLALTILGAAIATRNMHDRWLLCAIPAAISLYGAVNFRPPEILPLAILGDASYSIYLFHIYILKYFAMKLFPDNFVAAIGLCIGLCVATYFCLERPLNNFFKKSAPRSPKIKLA